MKDLLIKNAKIVNRGKIFEGDILVDKGRIIKVSAGISQEAKEIARDQWKEYLRDQNLHGL